MRRVLIICNTHFQIIVAIQLKLTLFENDEVDLHISDHSLNAELVAARLGRKGLFHDVRYRKTREEIGARRTSKLGSFASACFGRRRFPTYPDYDEVMFYNLNIPVYNVIDSAAASSKNTSFSGMEEGILSYGRMAYGKSPDALDTIRSATGHPPIKKNVSRFYCFFPELYRSQSQSVVPVRIPPILTTLAELRPILCDVFGYEPEPIEERFIYFASSSDIDGCGFGETELVLNIAKHVGASNILVKMHPRDNRSVYSDAGLAVMERSDVPWEVMQICGVADKSVCMTTTSGAFINPSALLNSEAEGFFWIVNQPGNDELEARMSFIESTLTSLHEAGICRGIRILPANDFSRAVGCEPVNSSDAITGV